MQLHSAWSYSIILHLVKNVVHYLPEASLFDQWAWV